MKTSFIVSMCVVAFLMAGTATVFGQACNSSENHCPPEKPYCQNNGGPRTALLDGHCQENQDYTQETRSDNKKKSAGTISNFIASLFAVPPRQVPPAAAAVAQYAAPTIYKATQLVAPVAYKAIQLILPIAPCGAAGPSAGSNSNGFNNRAIFCIEKDPPLTDLDKQNIKDLYACYASVPNTSFNGQCNSRHPDGFEAASRKCGKWDYPPSGSE